MTVRQLLAAARLQLAVMRRGPAQLLVVVTTPLFATMFLSIAEQSHSNRVLVSGAIAPVLIGLWLVSLDLATTLVNSERRGSTLELIVASLTSLVPVLAGRLIAVTALGGLCALETWFVGLGFGVVLVPVHPVLLLVALASGVFATVGTATMLGVCLSMSRNSYVLQNALSYPLYILGCIAVPAQLLPGWLRPATHFVFFSWLENLLRGAFGYGSVDHWQREVVYVLLLGLASFVLAYFVCRYIVRRLATVGTITFG